MTMLWYAVLQSAFSKCIHLQRHTQRQVYLNHAFKTLLTVSLAESEAAHPISEQTRCYFRSGLMLQNTSNYKMQIAGCALSSMCGDNKETLGETFFRMIRRQQKRRAEGKKHVVKRKEGAI